ncbi:MAG: YicC/YloC family endoribonuclease [Bacteroidales bacterium]
MIKSMTGFGKHVIDLPDKHVVIEIRSLNGKQLDIHLRIPNLYKEKESEIRQIASKLLVRGKIELTITVENTGESTNYSINKALAARYGEELRELSRSLDKNGNPELLPLIIKLPEVLTSKIEMLEDKEWTKVRAGLEKAMQQVDQFREEEGQALFKDFQKRIGLINGHHQHIEPLEKSREEHIKEKILVRMKEVADNNQMDENRFEQELIYYLERMDITEERVRLQKHCDYFLHTLDTPESSGRKLSFISQEIGREINTIGSKANDAGIQKKVILMKDELEKIKEQLYNVL